MAIVSVENLKMSYGKGRVQALKGVSFDVGEGEIFGLIGPDGAGKTSLFRVLTTLLLADSGTAVVDGMDVVKDYKKIRQHIGYMPGRFSLYRSDGRGKFVVLCYCIQHHNRRKLPLGRGYIPSDRTVQETQGR